MQSCIHLLEVHSSKVAQVALIPKQPTGEENFIFPTRDLLHDPTGNPTGSHKNPTGYSQGVYSVSREQFQRMKHRGWIHQTM